MLPNIVFVLGLLQFPITFTFFYFICTIQWTMLGPFNHCLKLFFLYRGNLKRNTYCIMHSTQHYAFAAFQTEGYLVQICIVFASGIPNRICPFQAPDLLPFLHLVLFCISCDILICLSYQKFAIGFPVGWLKENILHRSLWISVKITENTGERLWIIKISRLASHNSKEIFVVPKIDPRSSLLIIPEILLWNIQCIIL